MSGSDEHLASQFPRFLQIGPWPVNSYKVCLFAGGYAAILTCAYLASTAGISASGVAAVCLAIFGFGLIGARVYYLLVNGRPAPGNEGGLALFGALPGLMLVVLAGAWLMAMPALELFDIIAGGVIVGGPFIRFGCVMNGCCAGRPTEGRFGLPMHDTRGHIVRRLPVQYFEIACWLAMVSAFIVIWPYHLPHGSYGLGLLAGYGAIRFVLEPMREFRQTTARGLLIDRAIALGLILIGLTGLAVELIQAP